MTTLSQLFALYQRDEQGGEDAQRLLAHVVRLPDADKASMLLLARDLWAVIAPTMSMPDGTAPPPAPPLVTLDEGAVKFAPVPTAKKPRKARA